MISYYHVLFIMQSVLSISLPNRFKSYQRFPSPQSSWARSSKIKSLISRMLKFPFLFLSLIVQFLQHIDIFQHYPITSSSIIGFTSQKISFGNSKTTQSLVPFSFIHGSSFLHHQISSNVKTHDYLLYYNHFLNSS